MRRDRTSRTGSADEGGATRPKSRAARTSLIMIRLPPATARTRSMTSGAAVSELLIATASTAERTTPRVGVTCPSERLAKRYMEFAGRFGLAGHEVPAA